MATLRQILDNITTFVGNNLEALKAKVVKKMISPVSLTTHRTVTGLSLFSMGSMNKLRNHNGGRGYFQKDYIQHS